MGLPGYRSPLRPVPDEVIPETDFLGSLSGESENTDPADEDRLVDSCGKQEWWHEAIKVAEEVEKIQKALDLTQMVSSTSPLNYLLILLLIVCSSICLNG